MSLPLSSELIARMAEIVGREYCIADPAQLVTYECDALTSQRVRPGLVVLPASTDEVQRVVRVANEAGVPIVPRGSGTGLSGGALPVPGCVVLGLSRMKRILEVDIDDQWLRVEPGVINLDVSKRLAPHGYYYAPDPSSQQVCSIGGNVAENSGGAHCLKYGFTTNHVLGLKLVVADGSIVELGGPVLDAPGYDLRAAVIGSEGTLGVVTEVVLRILRKPEVTRTAFATFDSVEHAGAAVSLIVAAGIVPSAIEMMDRLAIVAIKAATGVDWPDVAAALLLDVDGPSADVAHTFERATRLCRDAGALEVRTPKDELEQSTMWRGRKSAFAAMGRMSPSYIVQDGVIPRSEIARILKEIEQLAQAAGLRVANVFHAGDGNLHPLVLYDAAVPGEEERAERCSAAILKLCIDVGGSITGEHGVGADKAAYMGEMFGDEDLESMHWLRCAFDPTLRFNPGKVFPTPRLCGDMPGKYVPHPGELAGCDGPGLMSVERRAGGEQDEIAGVQPSWVYEPRTLDDAGAILRDQHATGAAVAFRGGGTALGLGRPPRRLDTVVNTRALSNIVEYVPADLVVTAEAGLTLAELQWAVARHGQRLALDAPEPERATLGGLVARADFGPRRARYGALRDLVLGVTLVRADGAVTKSGGKVVKNVAGFDLSKVVCGSLGTLGLIGRVTLRLHPLAEAEATLFLPEIGGAELLDLLRAIRHAQLEPCAVVALWGKASACALALTFEGFGPAVNDQCERVPRLARQAELAFERLDDAGAAALWARHDAVRRAPALRIRVATVPSRGAALRALLAPLVDALVEPSLVLYPTLGLAFAAGTPNDATALIPALAAARAALVQGGGSLVIEAAAPGLLADVDPWGPVRGGLEIMRALKQRFDPAGQLNPGRFVGGL